VFLPPPHFCGPLSEYCNLHGLWVGPKLNVAWEVAAATLLERTTQSETVAPDYYSSSTVDGAPVKHQPAVVASGDGYSIAVLGTDGTGLHPHVYDTHYIEAVYARDQHDSVAVYQELGENVDTAQSLVFNVPESSISLRPYEFCNLHGLWVGELVETASFETTDGTLVAAASVAAVAAATAASVCL
jgi:desulfoferrodoxin (superoxide reductase-like protein)